MTDTTDIDEKEFFTLGDAATLSGSSRYSVIKECIINKIPVKKMNRIILLHRKSLIPILESLKENGKGNKILIDELLKKLSFSEDC
jgi:hypothetical protein